jgi:hypothetical protein
LSITAARSKQLEMKEKGKGKEKPSVSASVDTVLINPPVSNSVTLALEKERGSRKGFKANVNRLASWFRVLQPASSKK